LLKNTFIGNTPWATEITGGNTTLDSNQVFSSPFGIVGHGGNMTIRRNVVKNCSVAGIHINGTANHVIENNVMVENADGIQVYSGTTQLTNNISAFNQNYGLHYFGPGPLTHNYNDIFANNVSNYNGVSPAPNDISIDPLFVDTSINDFHLLPNSPCIDAGDPTTPVPVGGGTNVDIGALEFITGENTIALLEPAPNIIVQTRKPSFVWSALRDSTGVLPASYRVLLAANSASATPDTSPILADTTWQIPNNLKMGKYYFWKVFAVSDSGDTVFSNVRRFSVITAPFLSLFFPLDPTVGRQPTFIWQSVNDTITSSRFNYQVILVEDCNFLAIDSSQILADTLWKVPYPLNFQKTYCWKVIAVSDSGDTIFSTTNSFSIQTPSFVKYIPNDVILVRQPTFGWMPISDTTLTIPIKYRVVLNKSFSSEDTSELISDTLWKTPYELSLYESYYWSLLAIYEDTVLSDTGVGLYFTVYPSQLSLSLPTDSSNLQIRQPSLIWRAIKDTSLSNPIVYQVILSKNGNFSPADSSATVTDTVWKAPYKLDLSQNYFWRVEAISQSGDVIFSDEERTFSIALPQFALATPANSSRVLVKQPAFNWGAVRDTSISDIFSYRAIYAKNPSFTGATSSPILTDTFYQVLTNLDIATTYYWKVLAFYSSANDTVFPNQNFSFLLAPTKLEVPGDRPTIQQAIDISLNGDTVLVKPGTYTQNILFKGKRIKLMSEGGPAVTTIAKLVDGFELVSFTNGEDSTTVLSGFTLTGARQVPSGAAINILGASPIIENNYIIDNSGQAAVIWADGGAPKIRRCLIVRDSGEAAIRFFNSSGGEVINCTISDNFGDGIRVQAGLPSTIINNIITANTGYGIRAMGGSNTNSTITYNDVFANNLGYFFATIPGEGNIFFDPLYRGGNPFSYQLISFSPCIDAGDPAFPVPPGGGSRIDMGAFERTASLPGDLNLDGILTAADVVLELNCVFLGVGDCPLNLADLNCDNILTAADVVILMNDVFLGIPPPCTF